ncbi:MAG: TerB family tellurite resistance protein [Candidatus Promineifilaceae bacterium]|jgi:DnaJ like chaperone protein
MSIWTRIAHATTDVLEGAHISERAHGLLGLLTGSHTLHHDGNHSANHQVAFTIGVISLGAKMAKADGRVTPDEVMAFKQVFEVPKGEMDSVSRIFNLAKEDAHNYEIYADQLASLLKSNRQLLGDILEGLFHIAMADRVFDPNEERFLEDIARRFGFTPTEFNNIKARHVGSLKSDPYQVLGVTRDIDNDALRRHYLKLVLENHPDKMIARGVPPEFVSRATKRVAAINAAYTELSKERQM